MTLYLVGLGVSPGTMTREAYNVLQNADTVILDGYTSLSPDLDKSWLEKTLSRKVLVAERTDLEGPGASRIIGKAGEADIALAVIGDPLTATTHLSLVVEAKRRGVPVRVIPGVSGVFLSKTISLLQIYKFGRTITITYPWGDIYPLSSVEMMMGNLCLGLHTLFLLDLRLDEKRAMTVDEAVDVLLKTYRRLVERGAPEFPLDMLIGIVIEAAGTSREKVVIDSLGSLARTGNGEPPQSLIVPAELHVSESEALETVYGASQGLLAVHNSVFREWRSSICRHVCSNI